MGLFCKEQPYVHIIFSYIMLAYDVELHTYPSICICSLCKTGFSNSAVAPPHLLSLVERLDLLDLVVAAHENTGFVMDALRHNLHHSLHTAVKRLTAG